MASNGLVANPSKTSQVLLNLNNKNKTEDQITIKIGQETIKQDKSAKLLGLTIDDDQGWKTNIYGSGGLL